MSMSNYWIAPRGPLELKTGDIHLWRVDLDRNPHHLPALEQTLAPAERRRAAAFRFAADRTRYSLTRGALRTILARYLIISPEKLVLRAGPQGKPELAGGELRFNVSHSDGLALFAITSAHDVGIDVERVRGGIEEDISAWFLSLRAIRLLEALPKPARQRAFFQGWTRMEAYSKASGDQISAGLENFDSFLRLRRPVFDAWWLHDFFPRRGYVATVAARARTCRFSYWRFAAGQAADSVGRRN